MSLSPFPHLLLLLLSFFSLLLLLPLCLCQSPSWTLITDPLTPVIRGHSAQVVGNTTMVVFGGVVTVDFVDGLSQNTYLLDLTRFVSHHTSHITHHMLS